MGMRPSPGLDGDFRDPRAARIIEAAITVLIRIIVAGGIFWLAGLGHWNYAFLVTAVVATGYLAEIKDALREGTRALREFET